MIQVPLMGLRKHFCSRASVVKEHEEHVAQSHISRTGHWLAFIKLNEGITYSCSIKLKTHIFSLIQLSWAPGVYTALDGGGGDMDWTTYFTMFNYKPNIWAARDGIRGIYVRVVGTLASHLWTLVRRRKAAHCLCESGSYGNGSECSLCAVKTEVPRERKREKDGESDEREDDCYVFSTLPVSS